MNFSTPFSREKVPLRVPEWWVVDVGADGADSVVGLRLWVITRGVWLRRTFTVMLTLCDRAVCDVVVADDGWMNEGWKGERSGE